MSVITRDEDTEKVLPPLYHTIPDMRMAPHQWETPRDYVSKIQEIVCLLKPDDHKPEQPEPAAGGGLEEEQMSAGQGGR
jgi:hypothetical protein